MIRLDRFMTEQNIASRNECRILCKKGLIRIDDVVCKDPAVKIDPETMKLTVCGEIVDYLPLRCYMMNKPTNVVCAVTDDKDTTVISLLKERDASGFFPIGRLDKDSEGLLLLTNDGKLCHDLTSPQKHVSKTYEVWITGKLTQSEIDDLQAGTDIGDKTPCLPAKVTVMEENPQYILSWEEKRKLPKNTPNQIIASHVQIMITEGRYHQVKRMFHANRHEVFQLKRTQIGTIVLDTSLKPGEYRLLTDDERGQL